MRGVTGDGHDLQTPPPPPLMDATVKSPDSFYCATELRNQDLVAMSAPLRLEQHYI